MPDYPTPPKRLLVVDDEANMRHMLTTLLKKFDYQVDTAANGIEAIEMVEQTMYDFILCDLKMPAMDGMTFLATARDKLWESTVIMMSAYGTIDMAIEALKAGAYDFISKPFKPDEVILTLKKAEERESLKRENRWLKDRIKKIQEHYSFGNMVGKSKAMEAVFTLAKKAAEVNTTVLITGESGTGKELIAQAIHVLGIRRQMPLIPVNCGSIPENLLESELFGHKKGSFTGADKDKQGLFEAADGGTIFLDEIGELPLSLQVKLLRTLQEGEIRRVGDSRTKKVDVRVLAATAKDLEVAIKRGAFREDLFYRLNVLQVRIPPLNERREDIPLLCQFFIERYNNLLDKGIIGITPAAMTRLQNHQWPGNVRELENAIERAIVLTEHNMIAPDHLPVEVGPAPPSSDPSGLFEGFSIKQAQKIIEEKLIVKALAKTQGNRTQAARLLEISHPSLLSKIKVYGIDG